MEPKERHAADTVDVMPGVAIAMAAVESEKVNSKSQQKKSAE